MRTGEDRWLWIVPSAMLARGRSGQRRRARLPQLSFGRWVLVATVVGLLARLLYVALTWHFRPAVDNYDYVVRAVYLWQHHGHLMPAVPAQRVDVLVRSLFGGAGHHVIRYRQAVTDSWWPPGYPAFLTLLIGLHQLLHVVGLVGSLPRAVPPFGLYGHHPESLFQFLRVVSTVLAVVIVPLLAWIGRAMMGPRVGLFAAFIVAVYPPLILVGASLFSESLFVPLLLASIVALIKLRQTGNRWWLLGAGLIFGYALLVHSDGAALLVVLAFGAWLAVRRPAPGTAVARGERPSRLRALWAPAALLLVAALVITPWAIRNAVKLHAFVPLSSSLDPTLAGTYNPVSAAWKLRPAGWIPAQQAYPRIAAEHFANGLARDRAYERAAIDYVKAHPRYVLRVLYWNTRRLLELTGVSRPGGSLQTAGFEGATYTLAWIGDIAFWLVALLAIAGAFTQLVRHGEHRWVWLVPAVAYLATVWITTNTPRFRSSIDPFLILAAAGALAAGEQRLAVRRSLRRARSVRPVAHNETQA